MFDPSIFDNLKIVLEGAVYDRDLDHRWTVLHRADLVDLSRMSRKFLIRCAVKDQPHVVAELSISSEIQDFAGEWLENVPWQSGCFLEIRFLTSLIQLNSCDVMQSQMHNIWGGRPLIRMHLSFVYPQKMGIYQAEISLHFDRKIDETNIVDIETLLDHVAVSLDYLNSLHQES